MKDVRYMGIKIFFLRGCPGKALLLPENLSCYPLRASRRAALGTLEV
jgi:hypothetical protein